VIADDGALALDANEPRRLILVGRQHAQHLLDQVAKREGLESPPCSSTTNAIAVRRSRILEDLGGAGTFGDEERGPDEVEHDELALPGERQHVLALT
jgi:hypothetical protein